MKRPVVVLDRDGTVVEDRHYIRDPKDLVFLPGAVEGLKTIRSKGYPIYLVSNQSGVGRGLILASEFQQVHRRFLELCTEAQVAFDEIAYCFHAPREQCLCRKPGVGLVPVQSRGGPIDWAASFVAGDHVPDLGLAAALGATPCLVKTGKGAVTLQGALPKGTQVFENLADFSSFIPAVG